MHKDINQNLKDSQKDLIKDTVSMPTPVTSSSKGRHAFYSKADKLITALYMVTDIIDKDEPLRPRLRILGTEIVSDMHSNSSEIGNKITEVVSLLNIAGAMNFISEMNCSILRKEFINLNTLLNENTSLKTTWLEDFLESKDEGNDQGGSMSDMSVGYKGQTRIGVQKGGTLMKALSNMNSEIKNTADRPILRAVDFDILKKERRFNIISTINKNGGSATIKDIMESIKNTSAGSVSFSEKTLQRELMSMIKDSVLYKTGEKRWSRYFIKAIGS